MIEGKRGKVAGGMALRTIVASRRMIYRFARRTRPIMAGHAGTRSAAELIVDMAALADNLRMFATQRKSCHLRMVKTFHGINTAHGLLRHHGGSRKKCGP